ncbi:hypothetical protein [Acidithiobacillus caldus]|uniref:hypothetical protein n=1 Tax=Acidithiobacillus caldus TaxID=33059 RepID=UPI00165FD298|nr:hypothetical protein [Acidithiobacillus caldus]
MATAETIAALTSRHTATAAPSSISVTAASATTVSTGSRQIRIPEQNSRSAIAKRRSIDPNVFIPSVRRTVATASPETGSTGIPRNPIFGSRGRINRSGGIGPRVSSVDTDGVLVRITPTTATARYDNGRS